MLQEKVADHWKEILDLIEGLWPTRYDKELTPALLSVWKRRLSHYPADLVKHILEDHSANSRFFPKVGEITREADRVINNKPAEQHSNDARREIEKMRAESENSWALADAILADLTARQLEEHKQTLLRQDWRTHWMKDKPASSRNWRALIVERVKNGLSPHEDNPECNPPERPESNDADLMSLLLEI